jgi:hypothetical protein
MLNETGAGAGGDSNGRTIGDVVVVGRSWFRMSSGDDEGAPEPLSPRKTARIGIDRRRIGVDRRMASDRRTSMAPIELPPPTQPQPVEWDEKTPRGTVTISWWMVGVVGAALMASGAVAAAMLRLRAAPAPAPAAALSAVPAPPAAPVTSAVRPPRPVMVEPLLTPPAPPSPVAAAEARAPAVRPAPPARVARPAATETAPARRAPLAPAKRSAPAAASTPNTPRSKVWVDPFAG